MRKVVTGEQVAQIANPDPFALPVWRAPVYRTPLGVVLAVKVFRLLAWLIRLIARHPLAASILALLALTWADLGWLGLVGLAAWVVVVLAAWRFFWPSSFTRWVKAPARGKWRTWFYRRRWAGVMTIADLAPQYLGRILLPVLGKVTATRYTNRVQVRLVSGQSAADFAQRAENLAHGFGAMLCRVRTARSGAVLLEFVRRDALAAIVVALPVPARPDLKALPVGIQGRRAVHRLPDQVPHQAGGRLPPGPDRRPAGPRHKAGRGAAIAAVLAAVRELAPVRHPAQERPARPGARLLQGQGA